jgi:hypothetical protein
MIVHQNPDLDAVACVALARARIDDVHFVPATHELPESCPCHGRPLRADERILDHPAGDKGRLDADGVRHAAVCSMPEAASADPALLAEVDEQDSTGRIARPRYSLGDMIAAIRAEGLAEGLRGHVLDVYVVEHGARLIRGLQRLYEGRQRARQAIDAGGIEIVGVGQHRFAVLAAQTPQVGIELAQRGICGAIYEDGRNLGVTRYPGYSEPDLRTLASRLPGWFIHSAGFLACWGSRKNPATSCPPVGTPQNARELVTLLRDTYGGHHGE